MKFIAALFLLLGADMASAASIPFTNCAQVEPAGNVPVPGPVTFDGSYVYFGSRSYSFINLVIRGESPTMEVIVGDYDGQLFRLECDAIHIQHTHGTNADSASL